MGALDYVAQIRCGGQRYMLWESFMVRRDYGDAVSLFQITAAEPGAYTGGWSSLRLKPGDSCQIELGGTRVIDGYVTTRKAAYDATTHQLLVAGKSKTCDLPQSSVIIKPGTYSGYTFEQAARAVLAPHPVGLVISNPPDIIGKPFKDLVVQYGETVHEFIERLSRLRGLILTDDADGNLVASQVDPNTAPVAELVEGRNILRAVGAIDDQSLWSRYSFASQQTGDDQTWPPRDIAATVTNPNARPNRVRLSVAEHPADLEDLQQRANYEAARSLWPSVQCTITVVGWKRSDGILWQPTENVSVYSPMLFPNESGAMLLGIQSCTYAQDSESGTTTTLELVLPQALTTRPDPGVATSPNGDLVDNPNPNQASGDAPDTP